MIYRIIESFLPCPARAWGAAAPSHLCSGPLGLLPPLQPLVFELNIPRTPQVSLDIGMEMAPLLFTPQVSLDNGMEMAPPLFTPQVSLDVGMEMAPPLFGGSSNHGGKQALAADPHPCLLLWRVPASPKMPITGGTWQPLLPIPLPW